jgi:hypothetical protein
VLKKLIEGWLGLIIISAFVPILAKAIAENELIRIVIESVARLFTW